MLIVGAASLVFMQIVVSICLWHSLPIVVSICLCRLLPTVLLLTGGFHLQEAAQALLTAVLAGSTLPGLIEKSSEYIGRAEQLKVASWLLSFIL